MIDKYILNEQGEPVVEPDLQKWGEWFEKIENRQVKVTEKGDVRVSTVFLGLDHSFGNGERLLWETMIFGGKYDSWCYRAATREAALTHHTQAMFLAWPNGG